MYVEVFWTNTQGTISSTEYLRNRKTSREEKRKSETQKKLLGVHEPNFIFSKKRNFSIVTCHQRTRAMQRNIPQYGPDPLISMCTSPRLMASRPCVLLCLSHKDIISQPCIQIFDLVAHSMHVLQESNSLRTPIEFYQYFFMRPANSFHQTE